MTPPTAGRLAEAIELARALAAADVAEDAGALEERLAELRFFVAVLGQFKRGKSSLINALVGEVVLPVGVVPVTSVVTIVRHGEAVGARVRERGQPWRAIALDEVAAFVSEASNPGNRRQIVAAEIFVPSPLLAHGLCLVDTPGVGSVIAANASETAAFLPHVDAAILVTGADPPISGEELDLLLAIAPRVTRIMLVLNKADRVGAAELAEAHRFAVAVLARHLPGRAVAVFDVSAREARQADADPRDWATLVGALQDLAARSGAELVAEAERRETRGLLERLMHRVRERRLALERPIEETRRRADDLARWAQAAERGVAELSHLLDAELERLNGWLDARRAELLREVALDHGTEAPAPAAREHALDEVRSRAEALVAGWRDALEPELARTFTAAAARFVGQVDELLARLRGAGEADGLPERMDVDTGLRGRPRYAFQAYMSEWRATLLVRLRDRLRGGRGRRNAAARRDRRFFVRLMETNASRVIGDLRDRAQENRRRIEAAVRAALRELAVTAATARDAAREVQSRGAAAVAAELARLGDLERRLIALGAAERISP